MYKLEYIIKKRSICILLIIALLMTTFSIMAINTYAFDDENIKSMTIIEKMQVNAIEYLRADLSNILNSIRMFKPLEDTYQKLKESYIGNGYYTIIIDNNNISSFAITFPFIHNGNIISIYDVLMDINGNIISGNYHNEYTFYDKYKYEDGIYIVNGLYESYILKSDNTLINTNREINDIIEIDDIIDESSVIDITKINNDYVKSSLGIDINDISNKKITNNNKIIISYDNNFLNDLSNDTTAISSTIAYNLSIPVLGQGRDFICWAACIAMIRNYRFSQWTLAPADIVNNSPVYPETFNARNFSDIRDTIYPYFIGTINNHYSSLSPTIVISEIDSNSALYLHTESATATTNNINDSLYHAVVGYGYYTSATTDRLWIIDPYTNSGTGGYDSITYDGTSTYGEYRLGGVGGIMEVWYTITY